MVRITEQEALRLGIAPSPKKPKNRKYNNNPCTLNGLRFDSVKERDYYLVLLDRQKRGEIFNLTLQEPIEILEAFTDARGVKHKPVIYTADFTYIENEQKHYIDVKGGNATKTRLYLLKKKLLAYKGIFLEEV